MSDNRGGTPSHIHIEKKQQPGWFKALAWLALIAGLLALLLALSRCGRDTAAVAPVTANETAVANDSAGVVAQTPGAPQADALGGTANGVSGLGTYLGGSGPTPATFAFEKLNFDTAKSEVRDADQAEVRQVADTLKQYGTAKVRIAGYADARGPDPANQKLGQARADAVKAALVAQGIDAGRIETTSGGESDPVDTNATAQGRFENRRTELVVTAR